MNEVYGADVNVYSTDRRVVLVKIQRIVWKCEGFRVERTLGVTVDVNAARWTGYFDSCSGEGCIFPFASRSAKTNDSRAD